LQRCGPTPLHRMSFAPVRLAADLRRAPREHTTAEVAAPLSHKLQESF
jgi:hypothetical protein